MPAVPNNPPAAGHQEPQIENLADHMRLREASASRLLLAFVCSGLVYMLLPGTFLGVWNLLKIADQRTLATLSDTWIQAHGVAQIFGWVGSIILGIGMYSIPKVRHEE